MTMNSNVPGDRSIDSLSASTARCERYQCTPDDVRDGFVLGGMLRLRVDKFCTRGVNERLRERSLRHVAVRPILYHRPRFERSAYLPINATPRLFIGVRNY